MADWRDCIVSYIDMIDVGALLRSRSRGAVDKMRKMHKGVMDTSAKLVAHAEVCLWNDSVLMVGFVTGSRTSYRDVMTEVCAVKEVVDAVRKSYAICVKGQAFPRPPSGMERQPSDSGRPSLIYLQASSLAFANCFVIEELARAKKSNSEWYIDNRIRTKLSLRQGDRSEELKLYPRSTIRKIHMYNGSFWGRERSGPDRTQAGGLRPTLSGRPYSLDASNGSAS